MKSRKKEHQEGEQKVSRTLGARASRVRGRSMKSRSTMNEE